MKIDSTRSMTLQTRLVPAFPAKHVDAILKHYSGATAAFQQGQWQLAITRTGQCIEAVLKALWVHTGGQLPPSRQFKVGRIVQDLKQLQNGLHSDAIRITIPRACEFAYDIASNRGARHDPDEVDPNEMDAHIVCNTVSWILAEMIRISQRGVASSAEIAALLTTVVERQYPIIEEVEGRTYFHIPGMSARQLAIVALWHKHPNRVSRAELLSILERHHVTRANAATALSRIGLIIDETESGMKLLQPGLREAEDIVKTVAGG